MTLEEEWEVLATTEQPEFPAAHNGVDLGLLVDDATECVSVFLMTGSIDVERKGTLRACESELRVALPSLNGPAAEYLAKVAELAEGVLLRVDRNRPSWLG